MSNRKNHNSLVFLTTLSVYLGLVLVGTPPISAQAALTQKVEIQNEAEIKDDLDKKPDEEKALSVYAATLEELLILAQELSAKNAGKLRDNNYEFGCFFNTTSSGKVSTCKGGSGIFTSAFIPLFETLHRVFPHSSVEDLQQVEFNLNLSDKEFSLRTTLTQDLNDEAERYQNVSDAALSRIKVEYVNDPRIITYKNTSVTFENNQVFIVTHLPRASIDELLAKKDAH